MTDIIFSLPTTLYLTALIHARHAREHTQTQKQSHRTTNFGIHTRAHTYTHRYGGLNFRLFYDQSHTCRAACREQNNSCCLDDLHSMKNYLIFHQVTKWSFPLSLKSFTWAHFRWIIRVPECSDV